MKKALLVTHVSGFVPQFELHNVTLLQTLGYEVHYASNFHNVSYGMDNRRLEGTGMICHQIDFSRSPFAFAAHTVACRQLKELLQKEHFSLLHCHTPVGAALARVVAAPYRKQGMKVLYTAHGFHFYQGAPWKYWLLFYPVERLLATVTDVLITINQEDYERAKRFCRWKKTKVEYVSGVGIDVAYWSGKELPLGERENIRTRVRKELGVTEKETLWLSVGELIPRKNQKAVILALAKEQGKNPKETNEWVRKYQEAIKQQQIKSTIRYVICGQGDLQEYLENLIRELGLSNQVTLLGYRQDIRNLLYAADWFVFPSKQEGMPVALLEAVAAEVPLIVSDIRGNREIVADMQIKGSLKEMQEKKKSIRWTWHRKQAGVLTVQGTLPQKYESGSIQKVMERIYKELA